MKTILILLFLFTFNLAIGQDKENPPKKSDEPPSTGDVKKDTTPTTPVAKKDEPPKTIKTFITQLNDKLMEMEKTKQDATLTSNQKQAILDTARVTADTLLKNIKDTATMKSKKYPYLEDLVKVKASKLEKLSTIGSGRVTIIGDAGVINNNAEGKSLSGNGSFGLQYVSPSGQYQTKGLIVILASPDTLVAKIDTANRSDGITNKGDFGRSILNPTSGASSVKSGVYEGKVFLVQLLPREGETGLNSGLAWSLAFSTRIWKDTARKSETANIFSANVGFFASALSIGTSPVKENNINISGQLSYITRFILGDITNNNSLRNELLGTTKEIFNGLELSMQIEFKLFKAFVNLPFIVNVNNITGFSRGQFVGGFSVTVPVATFDF